MIKTLNIPKRNLLKEGKAERKERVQTSMPMGTRTIKPKKGRGSYNRANFKKGECLD